MVQIILTTPAEAWQHFVNGVAGDDGTLQPPVLDDDGNIIIPGETLEERDVAAKQVLLNHMRLVAMGNAERHQLAAAAAQIQAALAQQGDQLVALTTIEVVTL
jgi:hypothetical protein